MCASRKSTFELSGSSMEHFRSVRWLAENFLLLCFQRAPSRAHLSYGSFSLFSFELFRANCVLRSDRNVQSRTYLYSVGRSLETSLHRAQELTRTFFSDEILRTELNYMCVYGSNMFARGQRTVQLLGPTFMVTCEHKKRKGKKCARDPKLCETRVRAMMFLRF